jgi:hypothetical protein
VRQLKPAKIHATEDPDVVAHWYCDEADGGSALFNYAYGQSGSASFVLVPKCAAIATGTGPFFAAIGPISTSSQGTTGSRLIAGVARSFYTESVSAQFGSARGVFVKDFSFAMWLQVANNATVSLFEYAATPAPLATGQLGFGLHKLGDGTLRIAYDLSATTTQIIDTGVIADTNSGGMGQLVHVGVTRGLSSVTSSFARVCLYKNGILAFSTNTAWAGATTSANFALSRFTIGAARRYASDATGDTPAFTGSTSASQRFDDVVLWAVEHSPAKMLSVYADAVRPWDETVLLSSGHYVTKHRVVVDNNDGTWTDLGQSFGRDWTVSVDVNDAADQQIASANIELRREIGKTVSLSNLNASSPFNQAATSLIEIRRRVRIDYAVVPPDWIIQGWEWEPLFQGRIENFDAAKNPMTINLIDDMAPFKDAMQLEPLSTDFGTTGTPAEGVIGGIITRNIPAIATDSVGAAATAVFGYVGARLPTATISLYTPLTSNWMIRYDDSPSARVNVLFQDIADQIGWDLAFSYYEPWRDWRLTFYEPPRAMALQLSRVEKEASGALLTFPAPHNLQPGQLLNIAGTTNYNTTTTQVTDRLSSTKVRVSFVPGGAPAAENNTGTVTFGANYTIPNRLVERVETLHKDVSNIRNYALVKFQRTEEPLTMQVTTGSYDGSAVGKISYLVTEDLDHLSAGQEFTVSGFANSLFNRTATAATLLSKRQIQMTGVGPGASTTENPAAGVLTSTYLAFKKAYSVASASIVKYGFQPVSVAEQSSSNINTGTEALALANRLVSDLSEPQADYTIQLPFFAPWFEVHDVLANEADNVQGRWSAAFNSAVVAVEHNLSGGGGKTKLTMRSAVPSLGTGWVDRVKNTFTKPVYPFQTLQQSDPGLYIHTIDRHIHIHHNRQSGRNHLRHRRGEVHVSTSASFIPNETTLVQMMDGNEFKFGHNPDGTLLTPGTTYFVRFRNRDVLGNLGLPSTASPIVVRFGQGSDAPAAKVWYLPSTTTSPLKASSSDYNVFPFNSTASPGFDNFGNFQLTSIGTPLFGSAGGVTSAFRMPCDGMCTVEASIGVQNNGTGKSLLTVNTGIFRVGPGGGSATVPVLLNPGLSEAKTLTPGTYGAAYSCASNIAVASYLHLSGSISAFSGDYIFVGMRVDALGGFIPQAANTSSVSACWATFRVIQD